MSDITIQANYGAVIFHDKSVRFVTEDEYSAIVVAYTTPSITKLRIGTGLYSKSAVQKILSMEEYWKEYPAALEEKKKKELEKRLEEHEKNKFKKYEQYESVTERPVGRNGLASMIKGLKRFIDESPIPTPKANLALTKLNKKYETQYQK